jgi:cytidylate kinase
MIQALILKKVIGVVMEKVAEKHRIKKLQDYVEKDNELDIQVKQQQKNISKQGKYIEGLEKKVAILEKNSHPPQEYICCRKCGCEIDKVKLK